MTAPASPTVLDPRRTRAVLAVVALSLMAVVSAVSGLNIALPSLARDIGASQTELTWIVDAYTVVFAGLLLFSGALGDRFGRRRVLLAGLAIFGIAAFLGMLVGDATELIIVRTLMGLGAAGIMPTTLSVITTSFPEKERPRAIGVWVGMAGGGAVLGLFASGLLLEYFEWQSFFGLNVVLAALGFVGVLRVVPESRDAEPPKLDLVGALLSLVAVTAAVFGIIEGPENGWDDPVTIAAIATGIVAAIAFIAWELRAPQPMLDPHLFRLRGFSAGTLTITLQFLAAFGFFFVAIQYLQFVTGRSPLDAAIALLPMPFVLLPVARNAPHLAQRVGFRVTGPVGLISMAIGFGILSQLQIDTDYWVFAVGLVFFAFGMGMAGTPATTAITASLPMAKQGVASAVNDTARELGSAFGIAILGSILNQSYRDGLVDTVAALPAEAAERVLSSIAFTSSPVIAQLGETGQRLVLAARESFLGGVGDALLVGAGLLVAAALVVLVVAPGRPARESSAAEEAAAAQPA